MTNTIIQFASLTELSVYFKAAQPKAYLINTLQNTVALKLTPSQLRVATERYKATLYKQVLSAW